MPRIIQPPLPGFENHVPILDFGESSLSVNEAEEPITEVAPMIDQPFLPGFDVLHFETQKLGEVTLA